MRSKKTHIDNNTFNERTSREHLIADCYERFGPEGAKQLKLLFDKWDKLLVKCKNETELKHMRKLACAEIYSSLGYSDGLLVGGEVVIPA